MNILRRLYFRIIHKEYRNKFGKLHRIDGPACEWLDGSNYWYINGKRHRADGPAREWSDGTKEWWVNGERHRFDGPAFEWPDGSKYWWVNGRELDKEKILDWYTKQELDSNVPLTINEQILFKLKFG